MPTIYWALIGGVAVLYVAARMILFADARANSLRIWSDLNQYSFHPETDASIGQDFAQLSRLTTHQNCSASNVVRGSLGPDRFCAFDFTDINRRRGKPSRKFSSIATSFAAVVVETDLVLPPVTIERETLSTKVAKEFGAEDVPFESDEFNRKFMVRSPDRARAASILGADVQQLLLDTPLFEFNAALDLLELSGSLVLARSRSDQFFSEVDYPQVLELLRTIIARVRSSSSRPAPQ